MNAPVDRQWVAQLLDNDALSYRSIAKKVGCSEWSVRAVARNLSGSTTRTSTIDSMKIERTPRDDASRESRSLGSWIVVGSIFAIPLVALWFSTRGDPPEGSMT